MTDGVYDGHQLFLCHCGRTVLVAINSICLSSTNSIANELNSSNYISSEVNKQTCQLQSGSEPQLQIGEKFYGSALTTVMSLGLSDGLANYQIHLQEK